MSESLKTLVVGGIYLLLQDRRAVTGRSLIEGKVVGSGPFVHVIVEKNNIFTVVNTPVADNAGAWLVEIMCDSRSYIVGLRPDDFEHVESNV